MSNQLTVEPDGLVVLRITGKHNRQIAISVGEELLRIGTEAGTLRVLVVLQGFEGWADDGWDDMGLVERDAELAPYIDRVAFVGESCWEEPVDILTGFSSDIVHYFATPPRGNRGSRLVEPAVVIGARAE